MNFKLLTLAGVILMGCIGTIVVLIRQNQTLTIERDQAQKYAMAEKTDVKRYTNEEGKETVRAEVIDLTKRNAKGMADDERLSKARQFDGVKDNMKNVDQVTSVDAEIDTLLEMTADSDTSFRYKDTFNDIHLIARVPLDSVKTKIKLDIQVPLTGAIFWQRKKFLGLRIGRKEYKADITCDNPLVKITGLEVIRIQKR